MTEPTTTRRDRPIPGTAVAFARWATLAAAAASVVAVAFTLHAFLRPMPTAGQADAPTPPPRVALADRTPTLDQRQTWLADLAERNPYRIGNDEWPIARGPNANPDADSDADPEAANADDGEGGTTAAASGTDPSTTAPTEPGRVLTAYDRIRVDTNPPTNIDKELKKLSLLGVVDIAGRPAAMLENRNKTVGKLPERTILSPGESFSDGDWTLTAIDTQGYRVIVTKDNVNAELTLFDAMPTPVLAARPEPIRLPDRPRPTEFRVQRQTEDEVRSALREAGIDRRLARELLRFATEDLPDPSQTTPAPGTPEDPTTVAGAPTPEQPSAAEVPDEAPSGIEEILRLLQSDPIGQPSTPPN